MTYLENLYKKASQYSTKLKGVAEAKELQAVLVENSFQETFTRVLAWYGSSAKPACEHGENPATLAFEEFVEAWEWLIQKLGIPGVYIPSCQFPDEWARSSGTRSMTN